MGNLDWAIPAPLKKERGPADSPITQRRSSRPSTTLLPWSPSTGTGGRHQSEMLVAINRKPRSPCPGARSLHEEITADYNDMIYAETSQKIEVRRKSFIRKWRIKHRAVADSLEEAGARLFRFSRLPQEQWESGP